ncbi:MAG: hypothetical protein HY662_01050 [Chloroflexi bacterium]|nr:hypothetical protein [Chloroflexota bacterium]
MIQRYMLPGDWAKFAAKRGGKIVLPRYLYPLSSPEVVFRIKPWKVTLCAYAGSEDLAADSFYRVPHTSLDYRLAIREKLWFKTLGFVTLRSLVRLLGRDDPASRLDRDSGKSVVFKVQGIMDRNIAVESNLYSLTSLDYSYQNLVSELLMSNRFLPLVKEFDFRLRVTASREATLYVSGIVSAERLQHFLDLVTEALKLLPSPVSLKGRI